MPFEALRLLRRKDQEILPLGIDALTIPGASNMPGTESFPKARVSPKATVPRVIEIARRDIVRHIESQTPTIVLLLGSRRGR